MGFDYNIVINFISEIHIKFPSFWHNRDSRWTVMHERERDLYMMQRGTDGELTIGEGSLL